ncbi:MAG: Acetoin utilization protein AcuC [Promethearchaeota archaeon]|nr:MAG: Acetoin utilization protein AcuC [Candidatus Lokiarchaeota archaeon]
MNNKVGLVYTEDFQLYNFGPSHPLRPLRLELTYSLMEKLELLNHQNIELIKPRMATQKEIELVHSHKYVEVVKKLSVNPDERGVKPYLYGLGPGDNPIFKKMYEASSLVCGASMEAAKKVWTEDEFPIAFNPAGGLHHAMTNKASGFCIFNDIAVALKYLKHLKPDIRIAYLDIDCHHGDGVQWIFYDDPNVLTISLHESGKFLFPGTGGVEETGEGEGKGYSLNFPLLPGTNNKLYLKIFKSCIPKILQAYQPDIIATQLGVDTHYNDPLTQLGVSIKLYKELAKLIKEYAKEYCNNHWLAFGGGGYLMTVVPRGWSLFLAEMLDVELSNSLPQHWIEEVEKKVRNETTPYKLYDDDHETALELLKYPELAQKLYGYVDSLIEMCQDKYLPALTKR